MKYRFLILFALTTSLLCYNNFSLREKLYSNEYAETKILYSQTSHSDEEIIKIIQSAQKYVYFAVYTITKQDIADALIAAKIRGLEVKGITDYNQSLITQEKPIINRLKNYGIEVKTPIKEIGLMHLKLLITDKAYASGSFNWTVSATKYNDEVLEIGKVKALHNKYLKVWQQLNKKY